METISISMERITHLKELKQYGYFPHIRHIGSSKKFVAICTDGINQMSEILSGEEYQFFKSLFHQANR